MGTNEGGVWVPISSPQFEGGMKSGACCNYSNDS